MQQIKQWLASLPIAGRAARIFRAPGRVNLIGEHTDYNDGFVMPAAINFSTWVVAAPRADRVITLTSAEFPGTVQADLDGPPVKPTGTWSDYSLGVAMMLEAAGHRLNGADLWICGNVPIGSGLSSSAAIEVATSLALTELSGYRITRVEMARICQKAENEFVGMRCGIMDQFISCCGQDGRALMLDCRSLDFRLLPIPKGYEIVICNTKVHHKLAGSEYNIRRRECEEAVNYLVQFIPECRALRDVTESDLVRHAGGLSETVRKRCRHVIGENRRVLAAATALENQQIIEFGALMIESHRSLRDDYEVSCPELDYMVEIALLQEGAIGARMTGGGFGGCTVNLVAEGAVSSFVKEVTVRYEKKTGLVPEVYTCVPAQGAEEVRD